MFSSVFPLFISVFMLSALAEKNTLRTVPYRPDCLYAHPLASFARPVLRVGVYDEGNTAGKGVEGIAMLLQGMYELCVGVVGKVHWSLM